MNKPIALHPFAQALLRQRLPAMLASLAVPGLAFASPSGGTVVAGQAGITTPAPGGTVINQTSQSAIINWQQFNIGGNEYVVFNQPNASAAVLNRVIGGNPSEILGNLSANGRVFLINPQGVIFGKGAQVDVGSLVATTMNIADQDFMAGRYVFANGTAAPVTNAGTLHAANGGFVVLAGDYTANTGVIQAKLGDVVLASGAAMTLDLAGDGLINLSVDQRALSDRAGVANLGEIAAQGGTVVMTAKVARNLAASAVNNSGVINAGGIAERGGDIYLTADGGDIANSGTLDVSSVTQDAGAIRITGSHDITLGAGSRLVGTGAGGGDLRVVAGHNLTVARGSFADASRSSASGRGGFIEYSGHGSVNIDDIVHVGTQGHYLIDPTDFTIGYGGNDGANISQATLESQLQNMSQGSTFTIDASSGTGTATGNINVLADLNGNAINGHGAPGYGGSLTLTAGPNGSVTFADQTTTLNIAGDITIHGGTTGGSQTLGNLDAGGAILVDGHGGISSGYLHARTGLSVTANTGDISFTNIEVSNMDGSGSYVTLSDIDASVTATTGSITGGPIFVDNHFVAQTTYATAAGMAATLELTAGGSVHLTGTTGVGDTIDVYGGGGRGTGGGIDIVASATITAGSDINISAPVSISGLDYHYTDSQQSEDIHAGGAQLTAHGSQVVVGGNISVNGEGTANIDVEGHHGITVNGDVGANATTATITEPDATTGNKLSLQYGYATVVLTADDGNGGTVPSSSVVKVGNIGAQGPNAIIAVTGGSVEAGRSGNAVTDYGISADATFGSHATTTITDSTGSTTLYQSNAGAAQISILTGGQNASGQGIVTHGGVLADGPSGQANLFSTHDVAVGGSILVNGQGYDQSGNASLDPLSQNNPGNTGLASFGNDAPFKLANGALHWGSAQVFIGSDNPNGPSGSAGKVTVAGGLTAHGVGKANVQVAASQFNVNDVSIYANPGSLQGTFTSQETVSGTLYNATRNIGNALGANGAVSGTANYGYANFDLTLANTADSTINGKLDVRGNSASASINGGHNVTINGAVLVGAPDGEAAPVYAEQVSYSNINVNSTGTAPNGHSDSITGDINVFSVGFEQALTGAFSTGANGITVEGTGVAGVGINSASANIGGLISVTQHAGSYTYLPLNGTATTTALNDALVWLKPTGAGSFTTGQISTTLATGANLHVGGSFNAGSNQVALLTSGAIDSKIPGQLLGFNHPLDGGQFPPTAQADRDLGGLAITTSDSIFFEFGADSTLDSLSLSAGKSLDVFGNFDGSSTGTTVAHALNAGANPLLQGGTVANSIEYVNLGATGTATIRAAGNGAVGTNVDIEHSTIGLPNGAATGSTLAVNVSADQAITVNATTINASSIGLTATGDNISVQGGSNLIAGTIQITGNGAGKNVNVNSSFLSTNGGVTGGNGDLKISSAGTFTINGSTLSDQAGGLGLISASGAGLASDFGNNSALFSGTLQIGVTGAGSSLTVNGNAFGPVTSTVGASRGSTPIAHGVTTTAALPGNLIISSSGNLGFNSSANLKQFSLSSGGTLHVNGNITATSTSLSGTQGVFSDQTSGLFLNTGALSVLSTAGPIDLTYSQITVGTGTTTLGSDPAMLANLGTFKPVATAPNAAFSSTGVVNLGILQMIGDYLYVRGTDAIYHGDLTHSGSPLLYNYVPANLGNGLNTTGATGFIAHYASVNGPNAVLTLVYGSSQYTGPITTGNNVGGTNTNFVFVSTNPNVSGYDAIQTQGQVAILSGGKLSIRGQTPPPPNVDPATQQQATTASYAANNVTPTSNNGGDQDKNKLTGDVNGAGSGGDTGKGDIENKSHDAVLDKSCT